jgi:4-hydroxybenzoate polyprenyltransferase
MPNLWLAETASSFALTRVRILLVHLRLHFQVLLAPIFLWGYFLAGGHPDRHFWLAFIAFHLFLYGGTTVYNSYYDRDEGPVGGLETPPPVTPEMLPFSLLMQAIGALLASLINLPFLLIYLTIFILFTAYSYPGSRLKGRPFVGLLTVALGQGVLAALAGWMTAQPGLYTLSGLDWIALLAAALLTTGFYPITQIYQIDADRGRGDITFAVRVGPRGTFIFGLVTMSLAAAILALIFNRLFGLLQTLMLAFFCLGLLGCIFYWAFTYDPSQVIMNYRRVMRLYRSLTLGFLGFLCLHFLGILPSAMAPG